MRFTMVAALTKGACLGKAHSSSGQIRELSIVHPSNHSKDGQDALYADQRRAAYTYVSEAFAEGRYDGIDGDCLAHAALFAAFVELVATYGEDAVAKFAERLPERIKAGEYSVRSKN